jgi:hypothetical protein
MARGCNRETNHQASYQPTLPQNSIRKERINHTEEGWKHIGEGNYTNV